MAKETKEDLKLLSSLEDILSKKVDERLKGAKEANALRSELLGTLRAEKDLTDGLISDFETYKELTGDVLDTSDKSRAVLDLQTNRISKVVELEKQRKIGQAAISDALNTQVDSLTSMVGNIPFIGSALKDAIDVDSLKDTVSGISESFTQGFSAAGMESGSLVDKMKGGFSAVTGNIGELTNGISLASIKQGILNVITSINPYVLIIASVVALIALVGKLISMGLKFNEQTTKIAKDLGVSVDEARDMEQSFNNISGSSKNLNVNTKSLLEAQKQLSDSTGLTAEFSEQMLTDQIQLTKFMGLSGDEAANFQKIASGNNQTAREMQGEIAGSVEQFNNATGASVSLKDVVQDIAKLPTDIRVGFKGTTAELARTVAMAKVMGTTLEESVAAGKATLDIESSLKNEAKARMLTGISINNNAIRAAQLGGDQAEVLRLQKEELGKIDNFNDMAPYQQEAISAAMGMTVDQIVKQKDAMELSAKAGIDLSEASIAQIEANGELSDIEKEKLIKQKEQVSAQEKLSAMSQKFGDMINKIVSGPLGQMAGLLVDIIVPAFDVIMFILTPITNGLAGIQKIISSLFDPAQSFKETLKEMGPLVTGLSVTFGIIAISILSSIVPGLITSAAAAIPLAVSMAGMAISAIATAVASTLGVAAITIAAGIGLAAAAYVGLADDMVAPSGYGDRVLTGPEGSIALNNKDSVIAGTDLFGNEGSGNQDSGTNQMGAIFQQLVSEVRGLRSDIQAQPIMITVDGRVVSEITRVQNKQSSFRK